ncbi:MAG: hypothetical protein WD025_07505 [Bacteriovoracaceae bacterium]
MKKLLAKMGLMTILGLFAISCATSTKEYHVELTDRPEEVAETEATAAEDTYGEFPYIDYGVTR